MGQRTRIVIAEDQALLREAFRRLLEPGFEVVGTVGDGAALLDAVRALHPDVALVDLQMPVLDGLQACERLRRDHPELPVVILTVEADPVLAARAFQAGASAYVVKNATEEEVTKAIGAVLAGRRHLSREIAGGDVGALPAPNATPRWDDLSPREREVAELVAEGLTMKEVAARLGLGRRTVEFYKHEPMKTLGLSSTADLIRAVLTRKPLQARSALPSRRNPWFYAIVARSDARTFHPGSWRPAEGTGGRR